MPSDITRLLTTLCHKVQSAALCYGKVQVLHPTPDDMPGVFRQQWEQFYGLQNALVGLLTALDSAGFDVPASWRSAIAEHTVFVQRGDDTLELASFDGAALDTMRREARGMLLTGARAMVKAADPPPAKRKRKPTIRLNADAGTVSIDGVEHRLNGQHAIDFVGVLLKKRGKLVLAGAIERAAGGVRPDKVYPKLPKPLQDIISKPGRGQSGYILR